MRRIALCLTLIIMSSTACLAQAAAPAQEDLMQYYSAIGTSDLIVLGTITDSQVPELPETVPQNPPRAQGAFSFNVEKALKGEADQETYTFSSPLKLFLSNDGTEDKPVYSVRGWSPDISKGQRIILFLQRAQGGYALTYKSYLENYENSFVPGDRADQVLKAIKDFPLSISLTLPAGMIPFAQKVSGKVIVKNNGAAPIMITGLNYEGYFPAAGLDRTPALTTVEQQPLLVDAAGQPSPVTVQPGGQIEFTLGLTLGKLQAWSMFGPDSGLLTTIALRALCSLSVPDSGGNPGPAILIASDWHPMITGFEPPAPFGSAAQ